MSRPSDDSPQPAGDPLRDPAAALAAPSAAAGSSTLTSEQPANAPATPTTTATATTKATATTTATARDRTASAAIEGFRYQALVTVKHLLHLDDGQRIVVEGSEDLVLETPPPATAPPGAVTSEVRVQVKNTAQLRIRWSEQRVYQAILEFLIQFVAVPDGQQVTFAYVTPATVGSESDAFIAAWKRAQVTGAFEPSFETDLEARLQERIDRVVDGAFRRQAQAALHACSDARLMAFARAMRWQDGECSSHALAEVLLRRLKPHARAARLTPEAALAVLISTILYRATLPLPLRVLEIGFIEATLAGATADADGWASEAQQYEVITAALARLEGKIDQTLEVVATLQTQSEQQAQVSSDRHLELLAGIHGNRDLMQRLLDLRGADGATAVLMQASLLKQGIADTTFVLGRASAPGDVDVVELIALGQFTPAIARIDERLTSAEPDRRSDLLYLKSCAYAGMNVRLASEAARDAAHLATGSRQLLLTKLADLHVGDVELSDDLLALATSDDAVVARHARVLVAEAAYRLDDHELMLRMIGSISNDPRATRLAIRAHIERGDLTAARHHLEFGVSRDDPEFDRLLATIEIRQFFVDLREFSRGLPSDYRARCQRVQETLQRAINRCPLEAIRRRHELVSNSGVAFTWSGDDDEAITRLKHAVKLDDSTAQPHFVLACTYGRRGDHAAALDEVRAVLRIGVRSHQAAIAAEARLLLPALALAGAVSDAEADDGCRVVEENAALPAALRARARLGRIRVRAIRRRIDEARTLLAQWPAVNDRSLERQLRDLAEIVIEHHAGAQERVVELADRLDAQDDVDRQTRHEALLHKTSALLHLKRVDDAANTGLRALGMGLGDVGADMVLLALGAARRDAEAIAIEDRLLARPRDAAVAHASRRDRLLRDGRLVDARPHAAAAATATQDLHDIYLAAAVCWHLGAHEAAAELALPMASRFRLSHHVALASACAAHRREWATAFTLADDQSQREPDDAVAVGIAVKRFMQAIQHGAMSPELIARADELVKRVDRLPENDRTLSREAFDVEVVVRRMRAQHVWRMRTLERYRRGEFDTAMLAALIGVNRSRAIEMVLRAPNLHLAAGELRSMSGEAALDLYLRYRRLVLDLPAMIAAGRTGLLHPLAGLWRLRVSAQDVADLDAYRSDLEDELAAARRGTLSHLSIGGFAQRSPGPIAEELAVVEATLAAIHSSCEIFQPSTTEPLVPDDQPAQLQAAVTFAAQRRDLGDLLVMGECTSLRIAPAINLNDLLQVVMTRSLMPMETYIAIALRGFALGMRRWNLPSVALDVALRHDGDQIGAWTTVVLAHLRQSRWVRPLLTALVVSYIVLWARKDQRTLTPPMAQALAAILHGRSYPKKHAREKLLREISVDVDRQATCDDASTKARIRTLLDGVSAHLRRPDPFLRDARFAGRTRAVETRKFALAAIDATPGADARVQTAAAG